MAYLHGNRITLVKPDIKYKTRLVNILNDKSISKFTHIPYPYDAKQAIAYVRKSKLAHKKKINYPYLISLSRTKDIIGGAGIVRIDKRDNHGEIGYWIGKPYRGKEYAMEATYLLLDYGFNKLKLNRLSINCSTKNSKSKKVIQKLGAKYEGIARQKILIGKRYHDEYVHSILRTEFPTIKKKLQKRMNTKWH